MKLPTIKWLRPFRRRSRLLTGDDLDGLRSRYFQYGFQYYAVARCATAAQANPVAANLFHHAVEMLLKGGLCAYTTEDERIKMGHRLPRIWKVFKEHHDSSGKLGRFDVFVRKLHRYEDIRYPERAVQIGSSFQFGNAPPLIISGKASHNLRTFHLSVGAADALVKAICDATGRNPKFFTMQIQPPGSTFLRHENAETDLW